MTTRCGLLNARQEVFKNEKIVFSNNDSHRSQHVYRV
jgi:hypothetical protein